MSCDNRETIEERYRALDAVRADLIKQEKAVLARIEVLCRQRYYYYRPRTLYDTVLPGLLCRLLRSRRVGPEATGLAMLLTWR